MHNPARLLLGLLALPLISALPATKRGEQVVNPTQDEFNDLLLYETYAAAAYCPENYNNGAKNRQLSCKSGNCDSAKNATIVLSIPPMGATGTTGYVAVDTDANLVIVAFRGTESFTNLIGANIPSIQKDQVPHTICPAGCGMGARGFLKSWTDVSAKVIKTVNDTLAATGNTRFKIVAAGHSLGAATATFATLELRQKFPSTRVDLGGIASPRIGDLALAQFISAQAPTRGQNYRVAHDLDAVPNAPPLTNLTNLVIMRKESFAHISPVYSIKSASKKPVTRNDIERIDNNPFIENKQDLDLLKGSIKFKFTQAVDAHTWYFNNVSYCYNVAGTAITTKLWPFEDVQQAVRFTTSEGADNSTTQTLPANDPPTNDPPANDPPAQISTAESSLPQTTSAANPSAQTTTDETTTTFSNLAAQTSPAKDLLATL